MLIIEGPDGSGKTTLGNQLLKDRVITRLLSSPRAEIADNFEINIRNYLNDHGSSFYTAVDRFFYSELVYGPILRQKICFSNDQLHRIRELVSSNFSVIILCLPPINEIRLDDKDKIDILPRLPQIYESYRGVILSSHQYVIVYNWTIDRAYEILVDRIRAMQSAKALYDYMNRIKRIEMN